MVANNQLGLKKAISLAIDWLEEIGQHIDPAIADFAEYKGIKTAGYYLGVLFAWVNYLFTGEVSKDEFIDKLADVIQQQLTRAWNEGMRLNGLDPSEMTEAMRSILTETIAKEYMFVDQFATDIASGNFSLAQLQSRAQVWGNRYNDVVNQSKIATADLKDKYEWIYGDTKHCLTCEKLNGLVATAKEWEIAGIYPQRPPNDNLSCGGWNCKCVLMPTTKRRSPKVLDTLLNIGVLI